MNYGWARDCWRIPTEWGIPAPRVFTSYTWQSNRNVQVFQLEIVRSRLAEMNRVYSTININRWNRDHTNKWECC